MDDRLSSGSLSDPPVAKLRLDPKLMGQKRSNTELGGQSEVGRKRIKMRDLHSIRDCGTETHYSVSSVSKEAKEHVHLGKNEETSEITKEPATTISDALQAVSTGQNALSLLKDAACLSLGHADNVTHPIDLNTEAEIAKNSALNVTAAHVNDNRKQSLFLEHHKVNDLNVKTSKDTGLDLNAVDGSNSVDQDPFYPYKSHDHVKSKDASECGSSTGPLEEKDSLRVWKEMKENGFLSSSHGGIPVPKQRERKSKNDLKKRIELAKREQVNRFTKIAAPSGLLNGLNPGIINHVRNSKQVHSIIESLVRSEKLENGIQSRPASQSKRAIEEINDKRKGPETMVASGAIQFSHSLHAEPPLQSTHSRKYPMSLNMHSTRLSSDHVHGHGSSNVAERRTSGESLGASLPTSHHMDEKLKMKLSSSMSLGSENMSTVSNEESANQASVSSLSVKAATVASQWLELLTQDIKGRLAALRRSKKRVQAVIQTELPFLLSREFSSNEENDPSSDMHRARWSSLFDQMEKTLTEEGKHLESWLNQVKEMQLHCEQGLQSVDWYGMQILGRPENGSRLKREREFAVRAAAASIYSTCNLVMATEDLSCN